MNIFILVFGLLSCTIYFYAAETKENDNTIIIRVKLSSDIFHFSGDSDDYKAFGIAVQPGRDVF